MLRKLKSLADLNKTKTPDAKQITTLLTTEERDTLRNKITNFCKEFSDEQKIVCNSASISPKQYITMQLEYHLGLKSHPACAKDYGPFAACLLDSTMTASQQYTIRTGAFDRAQTVDPITLHNDIAETFIKLYKKHLDTPSILNLLISDPYRVVSKIKPVFDAFADVSSINEHDFLFCGKLACNELRHFFAPVEAKHLKVIRQILIDLREHKLDTALHRDFILQILQSPGSEWDFLTYFKTINICSLIQQVDALPIDKENALAQLGPKFYYFYSEYLRDLEYYHFTEKADIRFALNQCLRGTPQNKVYRPNSMGSMLNNLRATGLDTPQNRENLYAKNQQERRDIYIILNLFVETQLYNNPFRQDFFQDILDKPENRWPLETLLKTLRKHRLLNNSNIKKIHHNRNLIPTIAEKLSHQTRITQDIFDNIITTTRDHVRDIAFFMSAHNRLGKASPAKTITTHESSISDPKYLPGFLSTFYHETPKLR